MSSQAPPLFPPHWFVGRFNEQAWERRTPGDPWPRYLTALDPLVMLAWHTATRLPPPVLIVTGM